MELSAFGRDRPSQTSSFNLAVGQQFHSTFPSPNARVERPNGRPFQDSHEGVMASHGDIVLEPVSGKIINPGRNDPNPLSNFYNNDTPWAPQNADNVGPWSGAAFITPNKGTIYRPPGQYPAFREPTRSNPDSHITGHQQHDSGYVTNGAGPKSVISGAEGGMDLVDENQSVVNGFGTLHLQNNGSYQDFNAPNFQWQEPERSTGASLACMHADCKLEQQRFKNASELKKHQQRHEKPHKCTIPGCPRKEGFTTKNDLDRHRKSLHGISLPHDRSFKCAGQQCIKKSKVWPRLDNFKSHIHRMHPKEDVEDLIKRSEVEPDKPEPVPAPSNHHIPVTTRSVASNEGKIQDANLLLDLSYGHGQHHPNTAYQNAVQGLGMNRIVSTSQLPTPQILQEPNLSASFPRLDSVVSQHPTNMTRRDSIQMEDLQLPAITNHQVPSNGGPGGILRSPASNERLAEQLQEGSPRTVLDSTHLLVARVEVEAFAGQLGIEISRELHLDPPTADRVQKLIQSKAQDLLATLKPSRGLSVGDDVAVAADAPSPRPKRVRCRICSKTMDRPCDLKKHEKRHSRPWGCTNATCNKTFGSKNDWKRHENSQHYQLETWRCHEAVASSKIGTCAKIFYRRDPFQVHLRRDHEVKDEEYIKEQCKRRRIGRNWQNGFWCGFCKAIVKLATRGLEAWDERFNHIDDMHFKMGQRIDDWYPMDKDLPKGKLKNLPSHRRRGSRDDGGDEFDVDGEYGYEDVRESTIDGGEVERDGADGEGEGEEESEPEAAGSEESEAEDYPASRAKRVRSNNDNGAVADREADLGTMAHHQGFNGLGREATPRNSRPEDWYCVHCTYGPMLMARDVACLSCGRRR